MHVKPETREKKLKIAMQNRALWIIFRSDTALEMNIKCPEMYSDEVSPAVNPLFRLEAYLSNV
jgi:hypothetical protein